MLTGSRIRARRLDLGLGQGALAATVGVSASYLNLIEHNRRTIRGKLLADIARALGLDPGPLADGAGPLLAGLRMAAQGLQVKPDLAGDFASRYPDWAGLVLAQAARIAGLQGHVATLTDRMAYDPALAGALHDVITAVTAIRSAASILVSGDGIDPDWQARFHRNINEDARKLAETARGLVDYLERPGDVGEPESVLAGFTAWLDARGHALPETGDVTLPDGPAAIPAKAWIARTRADALALPEPAFAPVAVAAGYDPARLATHFGVGLPLILRRLAALPAAGHPPMGLAVCDAAGGLTYLKRIAGFSLPLDAPACPLWPLYQALSQPGRPLRADLSQAQGQAQTLRCHAQADWVDAGFNAPPRTEAIMLVQYGGTGGPQVGPTCRLCPRSNCPARREPSILG